MIKNIYFNIICLFLVIFAICYYSEKIVNKYSYEKGKSINKVVIPDIIQENVSNIKNLDVISDLFVSAVTSIFFLLFIDIIVVIIIILIFNFT